MAGCMDRASPRAAPGLATSAKREGSPLDALGQSEAALQRPAAPEQKRTKTQHPRHRKKRPVKKADADETVLAAAELMLREAWLRHHAGAEAVDVPRAFGWEAGDQQAEAEFCRGPPVPAKLAGGDVAECELDVWVHEVTERGVGVAARETPEQIRELVAGGGRPWVFAVPFVLTGERVRVRSVRHEWGYTQCDLLKVAEKSALRIDAPCQYFAQCSGCQLQHVGYQDQLRFKRTVVERAFSDANPLFAKLPVSPVVQSPLPFGYRTKLTPHFDIRRDTAPEQVPIGFNQAGQRRVLDIEDCIIGTDAVRRGLSKARTDAQAKMAACKRGATLLVRETNVPADDPEGSVADVPASELVKDYTLNPKGWVTDVVGDLKFRYPASSFFQNNASILPAFTGYVRDELQKWNRHLASAKDGGAGVLRTLIDAYCGSGLFGIACYKDFDKVMGIEISNESISCADSNAKMNGANNAAFLLGDASKIFATVDAQP
ncbi:tRNA(m5U54)methyltransferase [Coemansia sp. RSA 552]|nr:tRNA(m5U54)methyltransferase [Coemansia sp. RSA 552]